MAKTVKGGRYIVRGKVVNAFGKELKGEDAKVAEAETPKGDADTLADVSFTEAAGELAKSEKLTAADFKGVKASGASGDFTKADVEAVVEKKKTG